MLFRDFPPKMPGKVPNEDKVDRKWIESGPKLCESGPKIGLDNFLRMREIKGFKNYYAHRIVTCQNIERLKCKL